MYSSAACGLATLIGNINQIIATDTTRKQRLTDDWEAGILLISGRCE